MTLMLVIMTCGIYQTGCSETTSAFYQSEPGLQEAVARYDTIVRNTLSDEQLTAIGTVVGIIQNKDIAIPLTNRVNFKLNTQNANMDVVYSISF